MRIGLRLGGFLPHLGALLGGLTHLRFASCELCARFLRNQGLRANLFVQVFNFLGARQQTRLFVVLSKKTDALKPYRMALWGENLLPRLQFLTQGKRFVQIFGGETTGQPVGHQGIERCIA